MELELWSIRKSCSGGQRMTENCVSWDDVVENVSRVIPAKQNTLSVTAV